jgi:hypothetical protein
MVNPRGNRIVVECELARNKSVLTRGANGRKVEVCYAQQAELELDLRGNYDTHIFGFQEAAND